MVFEQITYQGDGPIGVLTLNRPDDGNMFTAQMCHEVRDCINLEDLVGKKRAKEIWYRNPKMSAREASAIGLINKVVPDAELNAATCQMAHEIADRGAFALASVKAAFNARHGGVGGLSRMAHDLLLRGYLKTDESKELSKSFAEKRTPDTSQFGH